MTLQILRAEGHPRPKDNPPARFWTYYRLRRGALADVAGRLATLAGDDGPMSRRACDR